VRTLYLLDPYNNRWEIGGEKNCKKSEEQPRDKNAHQGLDSVQSEYTWI